jgi:hypothetical protein
MTTIKQLLLLLGIAFVGHSNADIILNEDVQCDAEVSVNSGSSSSVINVGVNVHNTALYINAKSSVDTDNNIAEGVGTKAPGNCTPDSPTEPVPEPAPEPTPEPTPEPRPEPAPKPAPGPPPFYCDYDCLSGSGEIKRSELSYDDLNSEAMDSLVEMEAFTLPFDAANPSNTFEGSFNFTALVLGWSKVKDRYNYADITDVKKLPDFNYDFIQHGTHLIPLNRGLQITNHYLWQLILEPGRVWDENSDNGYSRASVPFALQEYGANCTHNGVLTFLFKSDGSMSKVAYEIASETCEYYQFNMWGLLNGSFTPGTVQNAAQLKTDYEQEIVNRMPVKPISALAIDYPDANLDIDIIGSEQTTANRSAFGVAYKGVNYAADCDTRQGLFPYCSVMSLPSYSLAKSTFGAFGLMALEQLYDGAKTSILFSTCPSYRWSDVTLENALDMATGNYTSAGFKVDEGSEAMASGFFLDYTDNGKSSFSCSYPRKVAPGTTWVYHSTDSYLLGKAMDQYLGEDTYNWLVDYLYKPLGLSPSSYTSVRTFDIASQPVTGYGLTYHIDDLIKLAELLNNDGGKIDGIQKLRSSMVDETLQNTQYHGLKAGTSLDSYDNGFWIWKADAALGCANDVYIPYMSGFGGIAVVLLPNNMVYYFVSDNSENIFVNSIIELNKLGDFCN